MSEHTISITFRTNEQVTIEIRQSDVNTKRSFKEFLDFHDKTLYDWLTLLSSILLPFAIAVFTIGITIRDNTEQQKDRERDLEIASLRRDQDQYIADQQRNETILANYLKDISNLILKYGHHLGDHKARVTASSMTFIAIQQLNTEKKQLIIRYLYRMTFLDYVIFPNGSFFPYQRRNSNILSIKEWIYNGTDEKNIFNHSMIINEKEKINISQDILLEKYAKRYWIDRERITYTLSTIMYKDNITIQILFLNSNGTLLQTDRLECSHTNKKYHERDGLCRRNTHLIRVEVLIKSSKEKIFIEYIHFNLTSQFNMHP